MKRCGRLDFGDRATRKRILSSPMVMSYTNNIVRTAAENKNFRTVLHTGAKSQLVVMNIPAGGEIGEEVHPHVEQILYFQSGKGKAVLDGNATAVGSGDVVIVSPGTRHNFINTGDEPLIVATVYVPPNHIDGRVHRTKAEADADVEDEAFGEAVPV